MRALPLVLLAACSAGPNDLTLIDDVRLIAAIADPPSSAAGETYTLTSVIVEPFARPVDVLVWWCLPEGLGPCEVKTPELVDDQAITTLTAGLGVPVWIVACVDGVCRDPSEAQLRDPYAWLQELPLEGVTAAFRLARITELPPEERAPNPVFTEVPELPTEAVAPGTEVELAWTAPGAAIASGVTTWGAFGAVNRLVSEAGNVAVSWFAPDEPGESRLYLVVDDDHGGTAVWRGSVQVSD